MTKAAAGDTPYSWTYSLPPNLALLPRASHEANHFTAILFKFIHYGDKVRNETKDLKMRFTQPEKRIVLIGFAPH
jgi:hypothetical protein